MLVLSTVSIFTMTIFAIKPLLFFHILFIYFLTFFIVVQLQLSAFSAHPSQTHLPPPPLPSHLVLSMCPL